MYFLTQTQSVGIFLFLLSLLLIHFPTTLYGALFDGLWKKLWSVCLCGGMADYRKLFLYPFLGGSYSHSNLLWKTCMALLVLRILEFSVKAVGQEYKWSFITADHIPGIWAAKFVTLVSCIVTRGSYFGLASPFGCGSWEAVLAVGEGRVKKGEGLVATGRWLGFVTVTCFSKKELSGSSTSVAQSPLECSDPLPSPLAPQITHHTQTHTALQTHTEETQAQS